jgi:hypothetical protein
MNEGRRGRTVLAMTSLAESAYVHRDMPVTASSGVGIWLLALEPDTGEPTTVILPTRDRHHDPVPEADERLRAEGYRAVEWRSSGAERWATDLEALGGQ